MSAKKSSRFRVRRVTMSEKGVSYETSMVTGWLHGRRIRRQFKDHAQALGEKQTLEVQAANAVELKPRNTRLTEAQLAAAEAAFARLGDRPLGLAVDWFLTTYRPPVQPMGLTEAVSEFLKERSQHVRPVTLRDYKLTLENFANVRGVSHVHEVKPVDVSSYLASQGVGKKRWNNIRGDLHAFFEFCRRSPQQWAQENPVGAVVKFKVPRGIPEIESARKIAELFAFLETYDGPQHQHSAGFLVPYFALATFAGVRPSVPEGELCKIAQLPAGSRERVVDVPMGVIRIGPEVAKTKDVRQIAIQPNLAKWLGRYPLEKYPPFLPNMGHLVTAVRKRFSLGKDVLRHTFISMHVAKFKSLSVAALEAGNSEAMTKKHYLNLVGELESAAFWAISPTG